MSKTLKKPRLPWLSRRQRTMVNFFLAGLVAFLLWAMFEYPMFWGDWEFRRLALTYLAPEGKIVFSVTPVVINRRYYGGKVKGVDGSAVTFDDPWRVSVTEGWAVAGNLHLDWLTAYPRGEGADPVPLYPETVFTGHSFQRCELLLFLDMPERTSPFLPDGPGKAAVEIGPFEHEGRTVRLTGTGMDLGNGVWLFTLGVEHVFGTRRFDWYAGAPYVLRAYGGLDGELMLEQEGTIPKGVP